jgi:hypothetical protein
MYACVNAGVHVCVCDEYARVCRKPVYACVNVEVHVYSRVRMPSREYLGLPIHSRALTTLHTTAVRRPAFNTPAPHSPARGRRAPSRDVPTQRQCRRELVDEAYAKVRGAQENVLAALVPRKCAIRVCVRVCACLSAFFLSFHYTHCVTTLHYTAQIPPLQLLSAGRECVGGCSSSVVDTGSEKIEMDCLYEFVYGL